MLQRLGDRDNVLGGDLDLLAVGPHQPLVDIALDLLGLDAGLDDLACALSARMRDSNTCASAL